MTTRDVTTGPPGDLMSHISTSGGPRLDSDGEGMWLDVIHRMEEVYSELLRNEVDLERKNTELEEAQAFISSVIGTVSDCLIVCAGNGAIRTANRAFAALVGETADALAGRPIEPMIEAADRSRFAEMVTQSRAGRIAEADIHVLVPGGPAECLAFRASTLFDHAGKRIGTVLTGRPVSELRRAYQQLAEAHEELKQAQGRLIEQEKMASLGRLVAGVAHELNNPVSFVYGNIYTLDRYRKAITAYLDTVHGGSADEAARQRQALRIDRILNDLAPLLEGTIEGADRIADIVKNLRRLSFSGTGEREEVDLDKVLRTAAHLAARAKMSRAEVTVESAGPAWFMAHEGQIHQVLVNLIDNALDAVSGRPDGRVTLSLARNGKALELTVADNGPGIAKDALGKIFEPFFTTKSVGEGTGLGLWISFSIVKDYGGTITAENQPLGGALFTLRFPDGR